MNAQWNSLAERMGEWGCIITQLCKKLAGRRTKISRNAVFKHKDTYRT